MTEETKKNLEAINETTIPVKLKREIDWFKVIVFLHLNILSLLGIYLLPGAYIRTWLFGLLLILLGALGVTAGSHRLWAHKSYKASFNLKIFLMLCQTLVGQGNIYNWVLQHRIHHKYFKTPYDPYNPSKGFLYSHFISFLEKDHEHQDRLKAEIDMSDLHEDTVVMFQKKYYWILYFVVFALLPMNAPAEYWGENLITSCIIIGWLRYYIVLNIAWLVHSASEIWGLKPKEKYPCDSNIVFFVNKSHWIQYHYMVPWDYLTSEFGKYGTDCTSKFIRACAAVGCATELKTVEPDAIRDATFKSVETKTTLAECLAELEHNCVKNQHYLKPLNVVT